MYVKIFHIEIIQTFDVINKVLLAWYFKKLQSSNFTGENELVSSCLLIDFDESGAGTVSGGHVLCHTKEGFLQIHISPRFQMLWYWLICFHHMHPIGDPGA